jgi:hypothetical protein
MYSHLTDWELSIGCLVIAIFTMSPISIRADPPIHPIINMPQMDLDN